MWTKLASVAALAATLFCTGVLAQPAPGTTDMASMHARQSKLACAACHGDKAPVAQSAEESLDTVNKNCVACHGDAKSLAEKLAPRLANKHVNPHASHLVELDCATCHRGHKPNEAFCLQCHAFDMAMPPKPKK